MEGGNNEVPSGIKEVDRKEEDEEEEEEETSKDTLLNFMKEMREETARARKEDRERQEKMEERIRRAEGNKTPPPQDRRGGAGQSERGMENRGSGLGGGERKGQCKNQLMGRQCDRNCQYSHKRICRAYREKGRLGCYDRRCNLLHPYDCRSVSEGRICDRKECHTWHD